MLTLSNSEVDDHLGVEIEGETVEEEVFAGICHAYVTDPANDREAKKLDDWHLGDG